LVYNLLAFDDMSEYHVLPIQKMRSVGRNIKLRAVCILLA
jgi:hypothetical protein